MKETNVNNSNEIMLIEYGKIIIDPCQVATLLSVFYVNAGDIFNLTECDLLPIHGVLKIATDQLEPLLTHLMNRLSLNVSSQMNGNLWK